MYLQGFSSFSLAYSGLKTTEKLSFWYINYPNKILFHLNVSCSFEPRVSNGAIGLRYEANGTKIAINDSRNHEILVSLRIEFPDSVQVIWELKIGSP